MVRGAVSLSENPVGRGMVTIRPVTSTVGTTVGSLDVRANTVSLGKVAPDGARVPV
jgi:hypothetical protein